MPGSYIASNPSHFSQTKIEDSCTHVPGVPEEVGAGMSFSSSATKGALLIVPEGGKRIDHQQYSKFYKYAAECARSWYTHVNGPLMARGVHNGALYLVTGCDKARAWGVSSFIDAHPGSVSLEFVPRKAACKGGRPEYVFRRCNYASSSSGADNVCGKQSGCMFLRGLKIAVRLGPRFFPKIRAQVKYISDLDAEDLLPGKLRTPFPFSVGKQLDYFRLPGIGSNSGAHDPMDVDSEMDIDVPPRYQVYHPSDVINRWILSNFTEVEVAITHDDDWASVILDDEEQIPDDDKLIARISNFLTLDDSVSGHIYAHFNKHKRTPIPETEANPIKPGACARCKNLKVRCEFKTDTDPCKRCLNGGHECVIPGQKKRRTPPKREHLLNEIQKQAEEIQKLMAKLAKLEEAKKNTLHFPVTSDSSPLASPPILSPSSIHNSTYFDSDLSLARPEVDKDVEDWVAKARESLAEFGGFIGIAGANMPESYIVEQDREGSDDSGGNKDADNLDDSRNDGEYELTVIDDEGEDTRDRKRRRTSNKRLSGSKKIHPAGDLVIIPSEAVPFGLMAELSYKKQTKRQSSSDVEMEELETETRSSPGPDPVRTHVMDLPQVPHILARGIITPQEAKKLFKIFFELINPSVSIVDPVIYTVQNTVYRSPFLFTTICAISSRFYDEKSALYVQAMNYAQLAAGTALIGGPKNIEMCTAYILLSLYPPPVKRWEESRGWTYLGVAIRIATELNLHLPNTTKPQNEMHAREQLNRTRVWLNCFNLDRSTGSQNGKPPIISNNDYIANHSEDWWKSSSYNMKNFDIHLCCYNSELRVMAGFRSKIYSDPGHPTGLNKDVDFLKIAAETDEEFLELQRKWHPILDENVDNNDRIGAFRLGLLNLAFAYARLVVLSYGFQHAFGKNSSDDNPFLERCLNAANDIVKAMVEDIGRPSQRIFIRHGPEAQCVFVAFAAAFLVKLLQPKFAAYIDAAKRVSIRSRVQSVIDFFSNPEIAVDNRHGPKLYARFLKGLLASPMVAELNFLGYSRLFLSRKTNRSESPSTQSSEFSYLFEHESPASTAASLSPPPSHVAMSFDRFASSGGAIGPFASDHFHRSPYDMDYTHGPLPDGDELMRMQSMTDPTMWQDVTVSTNFNWLTQFQNEVQRSAPTAPPSYLSPAPSPHLDGSDPVAPTEQDEQRAVLQLSKSEKQTLFTEKLSSQEEEELARALEESTRASELLPSSPGAGPSRPPAIPIHSHSQQQQQHSE
ncbi:hypothetical protein BT96DRAFT_85827 [Gymnopus androsaceus JB14]|uniref:Zn(2)-C6 fungal-type domain-containing protein n=1 Tax=Gymnopus androsaceus JB14 TaxID=1447944 RepID=A0A6A4IFE4_9AGAR|nr:hypothetical protein BT96DRAFT_85827 [Gymnopus androsaceus JB14]